MKGKVLVKGLVLIAVLFLLSSNAIAQTGPCIGDLNCDGEVGGLDTIIYKADYPRSEYLNEPCPEYNPRCIPAPVAKTGQTTCYNSSGTVISCTGTGQDGEYQEDVAWPNPRFTDNGDGTVTDNLTGLIWLKDANCFGTRIWEDALSDANGLASGSCGLTDGSSAGNWRLPNRRELSSLVHDEYWSPALPNTAGTGQWSEEDPFSDVRNVYWTSTTYHPDTSRARYLYMSFGTSGSYPKATYDIPVWPVRGGND